MNQNIKVSVILTSYNHEDYLPESIESVLNQSSTNFELIIWDDGSTDNSWKIITSYSDPRIKTFRNKINRRGRNIKTAIEDVAHGDYIAIHHSDDVWEKEKLSKQVAFLDDNPQYKAVFTHINIIDEQGNLLTNKRHPYYNKFDQPNRTRFEWLNYFFYNGNALCHPSVLIHKSCFNEVNYRNGLGQLTDFDVWIQLCLQYEIYVLQEKLVHFRVNQHELNTSGNRPDSRIRLQFEQFQVLNHYKTLSSPIEFVNIFPEADQYLHHKNEDLLYALGMIAVNSGINKPTKLFGLNLIFQALNDPVRATALEKYQGFDKKAFINLTGTHDVFSVEDAQSYFGWLRWMINRIYKKIENFFLK